MAKRKTTAKQATAATTPKTDWQEVVVRQRTLLADTSTAVFELEMSLKALSDNYWTMDADALNCLISSLSRTASDIQNRIDMHLAYMPTPEDE